MSRWRRVRLSQSSTAAEFHQRIVTLHPWLGQFRRLANPRPLGSLWLVPGGRWESTKIDDPALPRNRFPSLGPDGPVGTVPGGLTGAPQVGFEPSFPCMIKITHGWK